MKIDITGFDQKYAEDFKNLNLEWLNKYGLTESHDLQILENPREVILDKGGFIYLAGFEGKIIGSAALLNEGDGQYELAKMTVDPSFRGMGIGKILLEKCFEKARQLGAKKIVLFSNAKLKAALNLYTRFGFKHVPVTGAPYVTADIKMEFQF
jgi:putative acetyltransferase